MVNFFQIVRIKFPYLPVDIKDTIELKLGTKEDYISFGYDAFRKEVYIDRKNLKYQLIGEERNPVLYRGVQIQATHLTAYLIISAKRFISFIAACAPIISLAG